MWLGMQQENRIATYLHENNAHPCHRNVSGYRMQQNRFARSELSKQARTDHAFEWRQCVANLQVTLLCSCTYLGRLSDGYMLVTHLRVRHLSDWYCLADNINLWQDPKPEPKLNSKRLSNASKLSTTSSFNINTQITRKHAIAKALQPEGHFDFAPVDLHIIIIFCFFCSKILRFGKFRVSTTNAGHVTPHPLSTIN